MSVHVSASAPRASLPFSGRRAPCAARHPPRVVPSAFGFGRSNQGPTLEQIEAEIRSAPPSTSPASTSRLSLADATWKVSLDNPLPVRDRAACAIAAEAVQALCETGLDGASLAVTLGIREAMIANGFGDGVRAVAGYVSIGGEGRAHAWLEIDGRVLDVAGEGLALCEAARRLGVDYSNVENMRSAFGPDALKHIGPFCPTIARTSTTSSLPTSRCAECFETAIRFGPSRKFLYKFLMHIFPGVTLEPGE